MKLRRGAQSGFFFRLLFFIRGTEREKDLKPKGKKQKKNGDEQHPC
jgi:hypothetical protein